MNILHAGFANHQLVLWGETPLDPKDKLKRKTSKEAVHISTFPYDAGYIVLTQTLKSIGYGHKIYKRDSGPAVAWSPTKGTKLFASSKIIDAPPTTRHKIKIEPLGR